MLAVCLFLSILVGNCMYEVYVYLIHPRGKSSLAMRSVWVVLFMGGTFGGAMGITVSMEVFGALLVIMAAAGLFLAYKAAKGHEHAKESSNGCGTLENIAYWSLGVLGVTLVVVSVVDCARLTMSGGEEVADTLDSYAIESAEASDAGIHVSGAGLSALVFHTYSADVKSEEVYVVMADERGDGGLTRREIPVSQAVIYQDADAGGARVEEVDTRVMLDATPLLVPVRVTGSARTEYRIHVPAGTLVAEAW